MSKSKNKIRRYRNLIKTTNNWLKYLYKKALGFGKHFEFDMKNLGKIKVQTNMLPPFKENFFDDIYLLKFPDSIDFNKPGAVVIDVGANVGFFSLALLAKYPKARVLSYEPHPYCYGILKEYKEEFNEYDMNIHNKAVGANNEPLILYASKTDGFATMASIFESESNIEKFEAESVTLASIFEMEKIEELALLKLDCEGSEYPIIYNAPDAVLNKVNAMTIETHQGKKDNENLSSLVKYLKEKSFKVEFLDDGYTGYIWAWK